MTRPLRTSDAEKADRRLDGGTAASTVRRSVRRLAVPGLFAAIFLVLPLLALGYGTGLFDGPTITSIPTPTTP